MRHSGRKQRRTTLFWTNLCRLSHRVLHRRVHSHLSLRRHLQRRIQKPQQRSRHGYDREMSAVAGQEGFQGKGENDRPLIVEAILEVCYNLFVNVGHQLTGLQMRSTYPKFRAAAIHPFLRDLRLMVQAERSSSSPLHLTPPRLPSRHLIFQNTGPHAQSPAIILEVLRQLNTFANHRAAHLPLQLPHLISRIKRKDVFRPRKSLTQLRSGEMVASAQTDLGRLLHILGQAQPISNMPHLLKLRKATEIWPRKKNSSCKKCPRLRDREVQLEAQNPARLLHLLGRFRRLQARTMGCRRQAK